MKEGEGRNERDDIALTRGSMYWHHIGGPAPRTARKTPVLFGDNVTESKVGQGVAREG